jgi:hypothetical protein
MVLLMVLLNITAEFCGGFNHLLIINTLFIYGKNLLFRKENGADAIDFGSMFGYYANQRTNKGN